MPIEWAITFLGTIVACVYFSYNSGMKSGVETATLLTLAKLEDDGLIHFDKYGTIKSGKGRKTAKKLLGEFVNEHDG
jgi:hypothetical protein